MLLIDKKLFKQGASMIEPFDEEQVTNIGYDLRTDCFFLDTNTSKKEVLPRCVGKICCSAEAFLI